MLVDLHDVNSTDSAGLNALLVARREGARTGTALRLARLSHSVARTLQITGADQALAVQPDVPAALPHS
ncbi:hypothetical protein GCM10023235_11680 [Kitasatospora terrestris]|uniref:STAS domain-containing protein n=1 Tax=Kitasatospora terrestris TaxID=258051 RepID=A0ABP9DBH8_9ACTN